MSIDVSGFKEGQKAMWTAGDYGEVAQRIVPVGEYIAERAGAAAGVELLDVATGTGNVSIPAARAGARVTGLDLTPKQGQPFASFVRCQQSPANLQPQDVGRLMQPKVRNEQARLEANQGLGEMTIRLLQDPLEADRRVDDIGHDQSPLGGPASVPIRLARES